MSQSDQKGFTLLEILLAIVIFVMVLGAVYTLYTASQTTFARGQGKVDVQQNARVAMGMVAREIRLAGYDPSDVINLLPTTAIETAGANTTTFVADVDGDGATDQVTYRLQGTQLMRDFSTWNGAAFPPAASAEVADRVTTLTFTYFDGNDVITATLADIRRVSIALTAQETAGNEQVTFQLPMDVRLRNLN